jgi:hypothetical protein
VDITRTVMKGKQNLHASKGFRDDLDKAKHFIHFNLGILTFKSRASCI